MQLCLSLTSLFKRPAVPGRNSQAKLESAAQNAKPRPIAHERCHSESPKSILYPYEKVLGLIAPKYPHLSTLMNPDPSVRANAIFWQEFELREWTKYTSKHGLKTAAQGLHELLDGNLEKAEILFRQALNTDPATPHFQFFLGEACRLQGDAESAIKLLQQSRSGHTGAPAPSLDLRDSLLFFVRPQHGHDACKPALTQAPQWRG